MAESDLKHSEITRAIISAFFAVYNRLGHGFIESRYATALERELRDRGRHVAREYHTRIYYRGEQIGFHRLDMVVDLAVVVEIKSTSALAPYARRQLRNYLRSTNLEVGLLLHFGPEPKYERMFMSNDINNKPVIKKPSHWDELAYLDDVIEREKRILEEQGIYEWDVPDPLDFDGDDPDFGDPPAPAPVP